MTPAAKAIKTRAALNQLGAEYSDRPDIVRAIRHFLGDVSAPQLAMLHDLVVSNETPTDAIAALSLDPR